MGDIRNVIKHYGLYDYDISTIKRIGHLIKVSNLKACRHPGLIVDHKFSKKGTVNSCKLENNISRAKTFAREYALCNQWDYFCTFTISPEKYDRYNFKIYYKDFAKFINNYNRSCKEVEKVKYLLIPEMHKDGAWHMHGLIKGIRDEDLYINQYGYISWIKYEEKFGFISFDRIRDIDLCSKYILKYITKDICESVFSLGNHLYYSSNGLKKGEHLYRGHLELLCNWDYIRPDGLCRVKTFVERKEDFNKYIRVCV